MKTKREVARLINHVKISCFAFLLPSVFQKPPHFPFTKTCMLPTDTEDVRRDYGTSMEGGCRGGAGGAALDVGDVTQAQFRMVGMHRCTVLRKVRVGRWTGWTVPSSILTIQKIWGAGTELRYPKCKVHQYRHYKGCVCKSAGIARPRSLPAAGMSPSGFTC